LHNRDFDFVGGVKGRDFFQNHVIESGGDGIILEPSMLKGLLS